MNIKKNRSILFQFINIFIFTLVLNRFFALTDINLKEVSQLGMLFILISTVFYYNYIPEKLNPFFLIILSTILFNYGHNILLALNFSNIDYIFNYNHTNSYINISGTIYTIYSILFFILGGSFYNERKNKIYKKRNNLITVGKLLLYFTIIPAFLVIFYEASISIKYGYIGIYQTANKFPFSKSLSIYFVPSIILLLIKYKKEKNNKQLKILNGITILYIILLLIVGGRTRALALILSILIINNIGGNSEKKYKNLKKSLINSMVILLILFLIPTFANFRKIENKNIESFKLTLKESQESNIIVKTIEELGYTGRPLLMTMNVIPSEMNFKMGESYVNAFLSAFPKSLDFTGYIKIANKRATLDRWLQDYYQMSYGPGYSLIAESYYNFGSYGIFILFIWGFVISNLVTIKTYKLVEYDPLVMYKKIVLLYGLFTLPRRQTIYFINQYLYLIILVNLLIKIIDYVSKKYYQ